MSGIGGARRAWPRGQRLAARAAMVIVFALVGIWPARVGAQAPAQVTLYSAINYAGTSKVVAGDVPSLVGSGFNDITSSISVPAGARVAAYADTNFSGACEDFTASDPDLRNNKIGNDKISSVKVGKACPVRLHADLNYTGAYKDVSGDIPDLRALGFDDRVTSIGVPAGMTVAVFEHPNYQGVCEDFTASDPDLRGNPIGDDSITSLQVGKVCPPQATLYADRNYGGAHHVVVFDTHYQDLLEGFQGVASSIHVTGGLQISGYYDPEYFGKPIVCTNFSANDPDLSNDAVGEDRMAWVFPGYHSNCQGQR